MNINELFDSKQFEKVTGFEKFLKFENESEWLLVAKSHFELKNYDKVKDLIKKYIHEHKFYYEYLCLKIDLLFIEDKLTEVAIILKEELNMPYLDEKYRNKFENDLQKILQARYTDKIEQRDIEQLLNSDEENQILAITLLKNSNIREYVDLIASVLSNNDYSLRIKNLLIALMFEQEYETKLELVFDNYYELISINEHSLKQQKLLADLISESSFTDDVTISRVFNEIATSVVINTFPQEISFEQYSSTLNALCCQMFNRDVMEDKLNMELLDYFKSLVY